MSEENPASTECPDEVGRCVRAHLCHAVELADVRCQLLCSAVPGCQHVELHRAACAINPSPVNLAARCQLGRLAHSAHSLTLGMADTALFRASSDSEPDEPPKKKARFFADDDSDDDVSGRVDTVHIESDDDERAPVAGPSRMVKEEAVDDAPQARNAGRKREMDWDARYFGGARIAAASLAL